MFKQLPLQKKLERSYTIYVVLLALVGIGALAVGWMMQRQVGKLGQQTLPAYAAVSDLHTALQGLQGGALRGDFRQPDSAKGPVTAANQQDAVKKQADRLNTLTGALNGLSADLKAADDKVTKALSLLDTLQRQAVADAQKQAALPGKTGITPQQLADSAKVYNSRIGGYVAQAAQALGVVQAALQAQTQGASGGGWMFWVLVGVVAVSLAVGALLIGTFSGKLSEGLFDPIKDVRQAIVQFTHNDLDARVDYDGDDEAGKLAKAFNKMAEVIQTTVKEQRVKDKKLNDQHHLIKDLEEKLDHTRDDYQKLLKQHRDKVAEFDRIKVDNSQINENLDRLVMSRTEELRAAMAELQSTQHKMILSEKMAALGQLVAGVAHEINSPIGAIKASVSNMQEILPKALERAPEILAALPEEERRRFGLLLDKLIHQKSETLSTKEERALRRQYTALLEDNDVDEADVVAQNLVSAGVHANPEAYLPLLKAGSAEEISKLFYQLGQMKINMDNIFLAVNKTNKIVYSLKSYTHRQDEDTILPINIGENLDTVLTLYHNQLKHGIRTTMNFQVTRPVLGNSDELGQIWTNLVQNAIQAMNGVGSLTVNLFERNDKVIVEIIDTGPGIPHELQEKIFEPFFTTKKRGEGTGLGLDICKKILSKHGGNIYLFSEPGNTKFVVELPPASPESEAYLQAQGMVPEKALA